MNKRIQKKKMLFPIKSVAKLKLSDGETLVIECGEKITMEHQHHILQWLQKMFPNNNVMVLPKDYKVKIISE